jgi:hypothetical protein
MSREACTRCGTVAEIGDAHLCIPRMAGKDRALPPDRAEPGLLALTGALRPADRVPERHKFVTLGRALLCIHPCQCTSDVECPHYDCGDMNCPACTYDGPETP